MTEIDELELRARVGGILNRWPAVGLAVGVVRDGSLDFFHGHGLADIASNTPVTEDTVFRIASDHQDVHRDRGDAAVGAGAGRPRRARQRLPARVPAGPGRRPASGPRPCATC